MKRSILFVALLALGCRPITTNEDVVIDSENSSLVDSDSVEVKKTYDDEPEVYRAAETILTDLINTKLEVSFDWTKSWMMGKETLTAKPHFYASNTLILDAKGMEIKTVKLANGTALNFTYEEDVLTITLDKKYQRTENYTVVIDYIAKPDERTTGGSAAITSDKGLYFINPTGTDKNKMPQIWTQGETEASSVWFPTIDAPNIKTKQEIYITVDPKYVTLSNGKLISSTKNANGTRTDYWKQDLAHAPYLFMMGIGEFKVIKDQYKRANGSTMEVNYYVEPEWEPYAKAIFGETPNMIAYFSQLLGVEYQWDKYSQIVVRDYVSGAMENTGAVVFGDYAYKTERELLDANDQSTIAHELFHHWFGDLVTCESWSNLSLNESFANYSQYLWDEHRFGLDEAEYQALSEADGYYASAAQAGYHDLIWFDYPKQEDMFDGHSYNKGGRILHMLRSYLGDEAFFTALQNYLKTNSFKPAEFQQLRLAFEDVSGEDLNWFFNQWYLDKGHPTLSVAYAVDAENSAVDINVEQKQLDEFRLFKLPVDITVFDDRGATTERVWVTDKINTFSLSYVGTLKNVIFDNQAMLLAKITETKDPSWYIHQYYTGKHYIQRKNALQFGLKNKTPEAEKMILDALNDPFWDIRATAIERYTRLAGTNKTEALEKIKLLALNDSVSSVRASALNVLSSNLAVAEASALLEDRIKNDRSYTVITAALGQLSKIDASKSMALAKTLENEKSSKMLAGIAMLYGKSGAASNYSFYEKAFASNTLQGYDKLGALNSFTYFMSQQEVSLQRKALPIFENEGVNGGTFAHMFLPQYIEYLKATLSQKIDQLKQAETEAKNTGNTNATDIAHGKVTDAEALLNEYDVLLTKIQGAASHE